MQRHLTLDVQLTLVDDEPQSRRVSMKTNVKMASPFSAEKKRGGRRHEGLLIKNDLLKNNFHVRSCQIITTKLCQLFFEKKQLFHIY